MKDSANLCDPNELAALWQAGDVQALDHMHRCFGDRLLGAARRQCKSEHDAHDAFQDALLNGWQARQSYRGDGRLDAWLVRLVVNACHRMRRGRKNAPKLHVVDQELEDSGDSPEQAARRQELAESLNGALAELPERDRAIVLLTDVLGWKGPDVARQLGMTPGAVRTRLSRARGRLRDQLANLSR